VELSVLVLLLLRLLLLGWLGLLLLLGWLGLLLLLLLRGRRLRLRPRGARCAAFRSLRSPSNPSLAATAPCRRGGRRRCCCRSGRRRRCGCPWCGGCSLVGKGMARRRGLLLLGCRLPARLAVEKLGDALPHVGALCSARLLLLGWAARAAGEGPGTPNAARAGSA
jgi:hypothetical protein